MSLTNSPYVFNTRTDLNLRVILNTSVGEMVWNEGPNCPDFHEKLDHIPISKIPARQDYGSCPGNVQTPIHANTPILRSRQEDLLDGELDLKTLNRILGDLETLNEKTKHFG